MQRVFLTARADVEILGKLMTKDDVSEIENHMEVEKNHYAFSVSKDSFLLDLIKKSGVFAVNFSRIKNAEETRVDSRYLDKFERFGIPKRDAEKINCPLIAGADVLECELIRIIEMGERAIVIGNVLKKHKV
jgi:flavin reductase (DIM6/NTAB) family NADH-FMN oxidoreductase RutF